MQKRSKAEARRSILLCLFFLGLVTAVIVLPSRLGDAASTKGLIIRTESGKEDLPNYDIRREKGDEVATYLEQVRNSLAKNAVAVENIRDSFVRGEESLKAQLP